MINYVLLVSRQVLPLPGYRPVPRGLATRSGRTVLTIPGSTGKLRLAKWFVTLTSKAKAKIVQEVSQLALSRRPRMCNFLEYKGRKIVYRRYASLFFICEIGENDNELVTLEVIHRYVEVLDKYFGNVCEMDLIFNFQKAYAILDELVLAGEMQETSRGTVLQATEASDVWEENDQIRAAINEAYFA